MSDEVPLRIGNAERDSAMKALDEHLAAGRLGVDEYSERSAAAAAATTAAELKALFTDLPPPHPELPTALAPAPRPEGALAERSGGFLEAWGGRIVAVTPIVALGLFFLTRQWWFFLLIPLVAALVYGGKNDRRGAGA
ncbi:protein of unknown function [Pseudonocardia thermophila]|uniref:DUF1707 domain-containing protein n=1 Tax=Pseudonocardia thermophila TaxID=1848 RepID=A0A1M6TKA2_PSETH|nr:DUF1707 domain-containing protein [Pseudonocardia thermophila]SHK57336.1 protein of unknown function [Pseudonocardia thermophila]